MPVLGSRWVFLYKIDESGSISRYKAHLVVQGCQQNLDEVICIARWTRTDRIAYLRVVLTYAARYGKKVWAFDLSAAYLKGRLMETVFMGQPRLYDDGSGRVRRLCRPVYGLRQAGNAWWRTFVAGLRELGWYPSSVDPAIEYRNSGTAGAPLDLRHTHVDDGIVIADDSEELISNVPNTFSGRNAGPARLVLGMLV